MLKFLRGRKRTRNAVLIIFVGLLTLSLVALFSASGSGAKMLGGPAGNDTPIAKVGSYEVTVQDLKDALANFGQQIAQGQGKTTKQDISTLFDQYGMQVLDGLIRQKLILYEAEKLSLGASDAEVQTQLRQIFTPWPGPDSTSCCGASRKTAQRFAAATYLICRSASTEANSRSSSAVRFPRVLARRIR